MPVVEDLKKIAEPLTGVGRPQSVTPRARKPHLFRFADDGETPNNPHFGLILYRSPLRLDPDFDPAALFEMLFAANGWKDGWRDGIYDFNHFHTATHEVLGIARGHVRVRFGGESGRIVDLRAGDVVVLPAGTGHRRLSKSRNLLVVGAYPRAGSYDEPKPSGISHAKAVERIARVVPPPRDPVYGADGPLTKIWRKPHGSKKAGG